MRFRPFEEEGTPIEDQFMNWNSMIKSPYDKNAVDAYTRARVILMNGIENNSVLMSHAVARMTDNDEIKRQLALIRRVDSQQQQTVNWLTPADQTVLETTLGYEQLAVDLTANLARNEENSYFKQVLDFALIEDFDHLFRYSKLIERLESKDPGSITQGKTEIKPGRPTVIEHRHPDDEMRMHFDKDEASTKTKMNYYTIVSAEQQTELFYKSHGFMYRNDLARKLYAEIAEIEEQHVSQYELVGDPNESPLEKMTLMQLNEAYNYYSCMQTEPDERIRKIWQEFFSDEITHFIMCYELMQKFENKDIGDVLKAESIEPLIVLEPNKDYVNRIIDTQVDMQPYNMRFVRADKLPDNWKSFDYMERVNAGGVPSEDVVKHAEKVAA